MGKKCVTEDQNSCNICQKQFACVNNLYRHYKRTHKVEYKRICFECETCGKKCRSRESIKKHLRRHDSPLKKKPQLQCYVCKEVFRTYDYLEQHLTSSHEISFNILQLQFTSVQELKVWKSEYEGRSLCRFVSNGMPYIMKDGLKRRRLKCHRTGFFKSRGKGIKNLKYIGTNKINGTCPSTMQITEVAENNISVRVFEAHEGHDFSVKRLTLTPEERAHIAGQLSKGVSEIQILNSVKSSITESGKTERLGLLTKKDINNIKRDFKLKNSLLIEECEDGVRTWVHNITTTDHNPVLVFKHHGQQLDGFSDELFLLILMSKFQKSQLEEFGNDKMCIYSLNLFSLNLFTIFIIDSCGKGIPVCFCFSDGANSDLFKLLFECIKNNVGVFKPCLLISDDDVTLYETWMSVMGPAKHHILNPRSVLRNWSMYIKNKIPGNSSSLKRKTILESLRNLLNETDLDKFNTDINGFIKDLYMDENSKNYVNYFVNTYANKAEKWAYCYVQNLAVDKQDYLDEMYKKLKCSFLEGKCKKLVGAIESLLILVREVYFERELRLLTCEGVARTQIMRDSHYIALAKQTDPAVTVTVCLSESNKFNVTSFVNSSKFYTVEKRSVTHCPCVRKCPLCDLCIHMYTCTCTDNMINLNICKHVHLVSQKGLVRNEIDNVENISEPGDFDDDRVLDEICESVVLDSRIENHVSDDIATKCKLIVDLSRKIDSNDVTRNIVINHLDFALKTLNDYKNSDCIEKQNIDLHIQYSPEKRKTASTTAEPLSRAVSDAIRGTYCTSTEYIMNISSDYNNSYL